MFWKGDKTLDKQFVYKRKGINKNRDSLPHYREEMPWGRGYIDDWR